MEHCHRALAQRFAQRAGAVQRERRTHQGGDSPEHALVRLRYLLHVVAFAMRRLVTVEMVDADSVRRGRERSGHRLQRTRSDRGHHRAGLAVDPAKRRAGVGHRDLVAELPASHQSVRFVDPQNLRDRGRSVAENRQVLGDVLPHQAENQRLGERHGDGFVPQAELDRALETAPVLQPRSAGLHRRGQAVRGIAKIHRATLRRGRPRAGAPYRRLAFDDERRQPRCCGSCACPGDSTSRPNGGSRGRLQAGGWECRVRRCGLARAVRGSMNRTAALTGIGTTRQSRNVESCRTKYTACLNECPEFPVRPACRVSRRWLHVRSRDPKRRLPQTARLRVFPKLM